MKTCYATIPGGGFAEVSFCGRVRGHSGACRPGPVDIQAKLAFYPNQKNPARLSGRGVWRVVRCYDTMTKRPPVQVFPADGKEPSGRKFLYVNADRVYQKGSRVDPRKVLGV